MMPELGLDFTGWPVWAILILVATNTFREQISAFIPEAVHNFFRSRADRKKDREEHAQQIEEALLNSRLQHQAADQLRKSWREEQWAELLQQMQAWTHETLERQLVAILNSSERSNSELANLRLNSTRTNDLLSTMNANLTRLADLLSERDGKRPDS